MTFTYSLELISAYLLAAFWILPLIYAFWAAFHTGEYATRFDIFAPLTLENFRGIGPGTLSAIRDKHIFCHCILATASIARFNIGCLCICSHQLCWIQHCVQSGIGTIDDNPRDTDSSKLWYFGKNRDDRYYCGYWPAIYSKCILHFPIATDF